MAKPEWMPQRLYQWVKPRSLGLHLLFVVIAGGCLIAAWWQVHRAMQGNMLSYLYSVEWPAFAVVAGIGWWQMFHDTPEDIARRHDYHRRMREASAAVVARTLPRSSRALTVGSTEVESRVLGPAAPRTLPSGVSTPADHAALVPSGQLPDVFEPSPLLDAEDLPDDELAEYNRYLASLAVHGKAKTWRNPRGL